MDDDDKLRKAITKGHQAQTVLEDPLLRETFDAIEKDLITSFRTGTEEEARKYWALLRAHDEIILRLVGHVSNGRDAMREVERRNLQDRHARRTN